MTNNHNQTLLVTGAHGFLGSHVMDALRDAGYTNIVAPRSSDYDLTKEDQVANLFKDHNIDGLIHLAGYVGGLGKNKAEPVKFFYRNNMMNTLTIDYAHRAGVKKVITAGAGCGYPEFAPLPLKEDDFWNGLPQIDSAPYSLVKRLLAVMSEAYWRQYRWPIIVLIPGNIYGPYDNFDLEGAHVGPALVRKFVEAVDDGKDSIPVWGDGSPTRDFVYARDVADGFVQALEKLDEPAFLNLASGQESAIKDIVTNLVDITGFDGEIAWDTSRPSGQSRRLFDISKAREVIGYEPKHSLREGLKKTVDWYRANRTTARNEVD